ncbi:unnamed protein product [Victoria cruziana]
MDVDEVFEEFLALRRELLESYPGEMNEFFADGSSLNDFQKNPSSYFPQSPFLPTTNCEQLTAAPSSFNEPTISSQSTLGCSLDAVFPYKDGFLAAPDVAFSSSETPTFFPLVEDDELGFLCKSLCSSDSKEGISKQSMAQALGIPELEASGADTGMRSRQLKRRLEGQPSKNLMAERRRRKRLNDRLSMLRSVVPRISKMDRTSILGDTIDYTKELLARIKSLQEEVDLSEDSSNHLNLLTFFKQLEQNQGLVRNTPRFDVERKGADTRIDVCCAAKPGLLLSTVGTIEALGLEIQQCVISCFNDFGMQASCREDGEQRTRLRSEDIKQALLRNAGYGGRCN